MACSDSDWQVEWVIPPGRSRSLRLLALASLAVTLGACTRQDGLEEIPSDVFRPPLAEYVEAVDSGRAAARDHVTNRYLPGVSVAVGRAGEVVWAEAFGWADLSHDTRATPETLYPVGSISKSLTATAAGLLFERGLLDFEVPVQEYVPGFPEKRWPITTGQLMGHIASVHNYGMSEALRQAHCDRAVEALAVITEDTLLFEPGQEYRYSNYGFRLVGAVVESVAEEPYLDFMHREVFSAIGMERTVPDLGIIPEAATKYDRGSFRTLRRAQEVDMSCSMAAGGFLSTPSELVRFGFAMLYAEILQQETVDLFWTSQRLNSGEPTGYGYGWSVGTVRLGGDSGPTPMVSHGGGVLGGRASLLILPEEDMVVVTMTNSSTDVASLARRVAAFFRTPRSDRSDRVGLPQ
ncbi:serine hydrolase domain-containing protein [Gemmatimonadota bacterium]